MDNFKLQNDAQRSQSLKSRTSTFLGAIVPFMHDYTLRAYLLLKPKQKCDILIN